MQFCLLRDSGADPPASGYGRTHGILLRTRRLTIGSAPRRHLHIPDDDVDPLHAMLRMRRSGRLSLAVLSRKGVIVNGRLRSRAAVLGAGDTVQIGATTITVEAPRAANVAVLRISQPDGAVNRSAAARALVEPEAAPPSMSVWSWGLTLLVAAAFLLVPLVGVVMPAMQKPLRASSVLPSDALWSPGPLHTAHQFIGDNCTACHRTPFARVRDAQCTACHTDVQHHVDVHTSDVGLFRGARCAGCHFEHKQPSALVQRDPRLCTDCHARVDRLKQHPSIRNVSDFGTDHPDFRPSVLRNLGEGIWQATRLDRGDPAHFIERSHLLFSHAQHLNPKGIKSPQGDRVLTCQSCHHPNTSGRDMLPIRMESDCSGCHSLQFDEHDPSTVLPHGNLQAVFRTLQEHFSRQYLERDAQAHGAKGLARRPGAASEVMSSEQQQRARSWVDAQSLTIARELMEKRVCVDCHEVSHVAGAGGFEQWRVEPVRLTEIWMPLARFNHAAHSTQQCSSCHSAAPRSQHSSDVLMPRIAECRTCHGGSHAAKRVESGCLMCHEFHLPAHGRMAAPAPTLKVATPAAAAPGGSS
ncbi:MAG TPA: FHA domain-containing protein [Candidatus Dormibacteraeota bacterium]|nr:FHA domain-containing protein [Candidatus Dormibacteraeota bacterium]